MAKSNKARATKLERKSDKVAMNLNYQYSTTYREIKKLLMYYGLLKKHQKYKFSILEGSHHLSKVFGSKSTSKRPEFFLPLFLLEASFTLPLPNFAWDVIYDFNVAPR
ncbi:hypothetical protein PVK06_044221 [Gossypium arboreum]|uniref:Uncharacterized protein n=1 Tax=Gossypium arboreum TaxID=29729 RepID=A0ABR0MQK1_GOSAR|nr:hypothetical protein PVK06_044221 [Gossypium arboreum]